MLAVNLIFGKVKNSFGKQELSFVPCSHIEGINSVSIGMFATQNVYEEND